MAKFSQRSKDALVDVEPELVRLMNAAIIDTPIDFTIIEGVRSTATQQKYYTWGRSVINPNTGSIKDKNGKVIKPFGAIVTTRDGINKKSEHQKKANGKGKAIDFCPFIDGKLAWNNHASFATIAKHIKKKANELGIKIIWGGDWVKLYDAPHVELA